MCPALRGLARAVHPGVVPAHVAALGARRLLEELRREGHGAPHRQVRLHLIDTEDYRSSDLLHTPDASTRLYPRPTGYHVTTARVDSKCTVPGSEELQKAQPNGLQRLNVETLIQRVAPKLTSPKGFPSLKQRDRGLRVRSPAQ